MLGDLPQPLVTHSSHDTVRKRTQENLKTTREQQQSTYVRICSFITTPCESYVYKSEDEACFMVRRSEKTCLSFPGSTYSLCMYNVGTHYELLLSDGCQEKHQAYSCVTCTPKHTVKLSMIQRWIFTDFQTEFKDLASCIHNKKSPHLQSPTLPAESLNSGPPEISLMQGWPCQGGIQDLPFSIAVLYSSCFLRQCIEGKKKHKNRKKKKDRTIEKKEKEDNS